MARKTTYLFILTFTLLFLSVTPHSIPCPPSVGDGLSKPAAAGAKCPRDALKFGVCGSWLGLVTEVIGTKPSKECCTLLKGLADLEAAVCLCTAIKANVLNVLKLEVPVAVNLLINGCGKKIPDGFVC